MRANPGGQLDYKEIIGRDALAGRLWRVLECRSLVLTAERRMGKTSLVRKMVADPPAEHLPVYRDLEGVTSPLELVELVFHDVEEYLSRRNKLAERVRGLVREISGGEIAGFKFPPAVIPQWKHLLSRTIEDLAEHQDGKLVFFWDELPLMLHNIRRRLDEQTAMDVLDSLRALRQTHSKVRMVFTGSVGLHNVIASLKRAGYANDPTNDMDTVDVPPLDPVSARDLARQLIVGEALESSEPDRLAAEIAGAVDGLPYFIHHVVDQLAARRGTVTPEMVKQIVAECLVNPCDPWHLGHYRERIATYYETGEQSLALSVLDILATAGSPLTCDQVLNLVASKTAQANREDVLRMLKLLQRDHYLIQETDGTVRFRFGLIQRSWRLQRGLAV